MCSHGSQVPADFNLLQISQDGQALKLVVGFFRALFYAETEEACCYAVHVSLNGLYIFFNVCLCNACEGNVSLNGLCCSVVL